jgi:Tfp pilus assembly protein PilF
MALYLMGEIEKAGGDWAASYEYYQRMQREFYPEMSDLAKTMMVVDTRELVNLRA